MKRAIITAADLPESGEFLIPFDAVLTPLARDEAERRGLTIRALKASGNKIIRSQAAQIRMEAGTVYFPSEAKWLADLESELSLFPTGPHDDQVDALSYAARWAQRSAGPVPLAD